MSPSIHHVRWMIYILLTSGLATATPAGSLPACGGNLCYPVLVGPVLKSIAQDYCSYFLKYPRTTTVTVKTTSTVTKGFTQPAQTISVTATTQKTVLATVTNTATVPGQVIVNTVTETVTVNGLQKRDPSPLFTPPGGSGDGYRPPLLAAFAPAVISTACSCVVTPTTVTVTSTSKATATALQTVTRPAITTTVGTVTNTVTVIVTNTATVTAAPSTTRITETTTRTAAPAQTCNGDPGTPQRTVTGFLKPIATTYPPRSLTPSRIPSAEECYNYCKAFRSPFPDDPIVIRSYTFNPNAQPGATFPGSCACYVSQVCFVLDNDPAGDTIGGDLALPF